MSDVKKEDWRDGAIQARSNKHTRDWLMNFFVHSVFNILFYFGLIFNSNDQGCE